jgi:hypothetical protein
VLFTEENTGEVPSKGRRRRYVHILAFLADTTGGCFLARLSEETENTPLISTGPALSSSPSSVTMCLQRHHHASRLALR